MSEEKSVTPKVNYQAAVELISLELAGKLIKNHHDQNGFENSHSYNIGKDILVKILSQPGCAGISFRDAVNEYGQKTLVYVGIDSGGKAILEITVVNEEGAIAVIEGLVGDRTNPTAWVH
jgi:hypothetical protein